MSHLFTRPAHPSDFKLDVTVSGKPSRPASPSGGPPLCSRGPQLPHWLEIPFLPLFPCYLVNSVGAKTVPVTVTPESHRLAQGLDCCKPSRTFAYLYWFPSAAITNYHKLSSLNYTDLLFGSSAGPSCREGIQVRSLTWASPFLEAQREDPVACWQGLISYM